MQRFYEISRMLIYTRTLLFLLLLNMDKKITKNCKFFFAKSLKSKTHVYTYIRDTVVTKNLETS